MLRRAPGERLRLTWPMALLFLSIGAAGVAAFQATQAIRSHRRAVDTLLSDYAAFAAWSYGRQAFEEIATTLWAVLAPVGHEEPHQSPVVPTAASLARYYAEAAASCGCADDQRPVSYYVFTLGRADLERVGDPLTAPERAWLLDTLTAQMRGAYRPEWRAGVVSGGPDGWSGLYAYAPMATVWGDTIVYGFKFDEASFGRMFTAALGQKLLPEPLTRGLPNDAIVGVRVTAPGGTVLFESRGLPDWTYYADEPLDPRAGGLSVRVALRPEMAGRLVIGGLPKSRLPFLIGLLTLAAALAIVAVAQLRREARFARRRSEFVASVSHELRTPLAQIRLLLDTLRLGRFRTDEQRESSLHSIDRETLRLAHLVENVLLFSRSGHVPRPRDDAEPIALAAEVRHVVALFEPLAASRRATLALTASDDAVVRIRREALRQVLLNLLDNAVKYGPPGQTVTVSVHRAAAGARITVADQGPGVPAAERAAIWRQFYRGESPAARAAGGTGIGLPIVRDIVERHGGRGWVEDAPGGGAAFVVELPAAQVDREADAANAANAAGTTVAKATPVAPLAARGPGAPDPAGTTAGSAVPPSPAAAPAKEARIAADADAASAVSRAAESI